MELAVRAATRSTLISLSRVIEEKPIVIYVQSQKQAEKVGYWMGRKTPLRCLVLDYCERTGAVFDSTRFLFDGSRINLNKTADDMELEDGDTIDAFSEVYGG